MLKQRGKRFSTKNSKVKLAFRNGGKHRDVFGQTKTTRNCNDKPVLEGLRKVLQKREITLTGNTGWKEEYGNHKYENKYKNPPLIPSSSWQAESHWLPTTFRGHTSLCTWQVQGVFENGVMCEYPEKYINLKLLLPTVFPSITWWTSSSPNLEMSTYKEFFLPDHLEIDQTTIAFCASSMSSTAVTWC